MAELVITEANVGVAGSGKLTIGTAGEAIDRGEVVYLDPADLKYKLADNNVAATAGAVGFAQSPAAGDGDSLIISMNNAVIIVGATLTAGQMYYLASTPGKIELYSDLASTEFVTSIFRALTTTTAKLDFENTGVQIA